MRIAKRVLPPPSANSIASGRAPLSRSHPRARPRAARSPDTPPAAGRASHEATACDRQGEARSRPDASHAPCGPPAPPYARPQHPNAPPPDGSYSPGSPATHAPRTTRPAPPTTAAPAETDRDEATPQRPKDADHTEPDPIHPSETTPASPHRNARSGRHHRDAPSLPEDAAQEGRMPDARPDNRPQKPTAATPRSPGIPPEHAPSHGPGAPSGKAFGPHARLTARLPARLAPQAPRPTLRRRLLQPIARWRLAAIAAVQTGTALQLPRPLCKTRNPIPKLRVLQLNTRNLLLRSLHNRPRITASARTGTNHGQVDPFLHKPVNP